LLLPAPSLPGEAFVIEPPSHSRPSTGCWIAEVRFCARPGRRSEAPNPKE
jgi:hypothetical protein